MHELIDLVAHFVALAAMAVPFVVAWRIYRDIYGVLVGLWKPFLLIVVSLVPLYLLNAVFIIQYLTDVPIVPQSIEDPIFDVVMVATFLMIGYALLLMKRAFDNYGSMVKQSKESRDIRGR
jgi:hypothetical protein